MYEQIMHIWARNCMNKVKIAYKCREEAKKIEQLFGKFPELDSELRNAWRILLNTADNLERYDYDKR